MVLGLWNLRKGTTEEAQVKFQEHAVQLKVSI
jgi:hypothetical protein